MWYKTGTVTVTNGSATVTGSGTSWVAGAGIGEAFYGPDGKIYEISNIASNTSLTLASNYLGSTQSAQAYTIVPTQSYIRDLAADAASLISQYAGIATGAGAGKFPDGTAALPSVSFASDVDTGLFRVTTNVIGLATAGTERVRIDTNGNIGLGTAYGLTRLDVANGVSAGAITDVALFTQNTQANPTIGQGVRLSLAASASLTRAAAIEASVDAGTNGHKLSFLTNPNGAVPVERLRIDSAGTLTNYGNTILGDATTDTVTVNGYMGVGGVPNASYGVAVSSSALTGTGQQGVRSAITASSTATSYAYGSVSLVSTAAATFTVPNVAAYFAGVGTTGAGSTITSAHGLYISDQTQGTNNYGITSLVSSGTNKWNIYASGTAANYFAGNVGIASSAFAPAYLLDVGNGAPSAAIRVLGNGSASIDNRLIVGNTGNAAAGRGVAISLQPNGSSNSVEAVRLVGLQETLSSTANNASFAVQVANTSGTLTERLRIDSTGNVGIGGASSGGKLEIINAGTVNWLLNNTTGTVQTAAYAASSNGSIGTLSNHPFTLLTNNTERMRIDSAGNVGIGVTPSAWSTSARAVDIGNSVAIWRGDSAEARFGHNVYKDASQHIYKLTAAATLYNQSAGQHIWYTAPSGTAGNAITFTQSLAVGLGTTLALEGATSAAGTGIAFPATQLASSNANTLDDYREGTFTPTIVGTTTAGAGTYTSQVGRYTKIGNRVLFSIAIIWTAHTGTGNMKIGALPFTSANISNGFGFSTVGANNLTYSDHITAYVESNATTVAIATFASAGALTALALDTAATIYISGHYEV